MTTDPTVRQTVSLNGENLDSAGETVSKRNIVARPLLRKRRRWCGKVLGVIGLVVSVTLFAPSCAVSGSDAPNEPFGSGAKKLSASTVAGLKNDTGVDPIYVIVVSGTGSHIIGVPENIRVTDYESEEELWKSQGRVDIQNVELITTIRFQRNPLVNCIYYTSNGSLKKKCFD